MNKLLNNLNNLPLTMAITHSHETFKVFQGIIASIEADLPSESSKVLTLSLTHPEEDVILPAVIEYMHVVHGVTVKRADPTAVEKTSGAAGYLEDLLEKQPHLRTVLDNMPELKDLIKALDEGQSLEEAIDEFPELKPYLYVLAGHGMHKGKTLIEALEDHPVVGGILNDFNEYKESATVPHTCSKESVTEPSRVSREDVEFVLGMGAIMLTAAVSAKALYSSIKNK